MFKNVFMYLFICCCDWVFTSRTWENLRNNFTLVGLYRKVKKVFGLFPYFLIIFLANFAKNANFYTQHKRSIYLATTYVTNKWIRYLEESTGIVLFEDFQAVLHHAGGLTELHGAVGDLIAHHLITDHTSDYYVFKSGPLSSCGGKSFPETAWPEPAEFPPRQNQILSASPALRRWREIRFWWMSQQFAAG